MCRELRVLVTPSLLALHASAVLGLCVWCGFVGWVSVLGTLRIFHEVSGNCCFTLLLSAHERAQRRALLSDSRGSCAGLKELVSLRGPVRPGGGAGRGAEVAPGSILRELRVPAQASLAAPAPQTGRSLSCVA